MESGSVLSTVVVAAACVVPGAALAIPGVRGSDGESPEGGPSRALSPAEEERWLAGKAVFAREWQARDGLGSPGFNARSCAICHNAPVQGGAGGREFDVVSLGGSGHYDPSGQPGDRLVFMRQVREAIEKTPQVEGFVPAAFFDIRQTPSLLGLGRIDTIPEDEILKNEDPEDRDGDGVRGVASRVTVNGETEIGRFGWKGEVPRLRDFACQALGGEAGITAPDQGRDFGLVQDGDGASDPEISSQELDDLGFFLALLAPPRSGQGGDAVRRGEQLFSWVGCATCHVPVLYGNEGPVELYSDLLLHEVLPRPDPDKRPRVMVPFEGTKRARVHVQAKGTPAQDERPLFRTPPLWGIARTAPYLHDGRAPTLADAILAHEGEAAGARAEFTDLAEQDRAALIAFLEDL